MLTHLGLVAKVVRLCSSLKETVFYQNNGHVYKKIIKKLQITDTGIYTKDKTLTFTSQLLSFSKSLAV